MLTYEIRNQEKILILEPHGPLSSEDFDQLGEELDHWLIQHDRLRGVLIHVKEFPGWQDLASLMSHLRFVREHHEKVERVALVSDSTVAALGPKLVDLFIQSEVETFEYRDRDQAFDWLRSE